MKRFEIREDGVVFATIESRTAVAALRKATRQFPRRAADYNDFVGHVTWRAREPGKMSAASAEVSVPGRGDGRCTFHGDS